MKLSVVLRRRKGAKKKDKGSVRIMFIAIFLAFFVTFFLLKNGFGLFPVQYHWISYIGFAFIVIGMWFRQFKKEVVLIYYHKTMQPGDAALASKLVERQH